METQLKSLGDEAPRPIQKRASQILVWRPISTTYDSALNALTKCTAHTRRIR